MTRWRKTAFRFAFMSVVLSFGAGVWLLCQPFGKGERLPWMLAVAVWFLVSIHEAQQLHKLDPGASREDV